MNNNSIWIKIFYSPFFRLIISLIIIVAAEVFLLQLLIPRLIPSASGIFLVLKLFLMLLASCILLLIYVFLFRENEKRDISELSLNKLPRHALQRFLIGFLFQSLVILIIYLFGGYHILEINSLKMLITPFISGICTGIYEEIVFRGILFRLLEEKLGSIIALLLSSFLFGFIHTWNPNATLFSSIALSLELGLLLGMCFILTRSLWLPIFIHMSWNFTLTGIYNAPVSGSVWGKGLFTSEISGPEWLTGGAFGPEAAVHTVILGLLLSIFLFIKAKKENKLKPYNMS